MFSHAFTVLVGLAVASSRETARPMPTITNSLVNLGKMEVSFYFSGNGREGPSHVMKPDHGPSHPQNFFPKLETFVEEHCPCSSQRNNKDSFPTGLINKILSGSDLFSIPNDPVKSSLCCDSHEHIQEGSIYFEFTPEVKPMKPSGNGAKANPLPMMPFIFDTVIPSKTILPAAKAKSIEVFMFPKKKDMATVRNVFEGQRLKKHRDTVPTDEITVVGDKKLENNIELYKPPPPVKKDLSAQQNSQLSDIKKSENDKPAEEGDKIIIEPSSKPNTV